MNHNDSNDDAIVMQNYTYIFKLHTEDRSIPSAFNCTELKIGKKSPEGFFKKIVLIRVGWWGRGGGGS